MSDELVNRLRMNNIFPTAGFNPLGPPDMNSGYADFDTIDRLNNRYQSNQAAGMQRQQDMIRFQNRENSLNQPRQPGLNAIAQNTSGAAGYNYAQTPYNAGNENTAQNVVYKPPPSEMETPYQKGLLAVREQQLAGGPLAQAKLAQKASIDQQRVDISKGDAATRAGRAAVYKFKAENPGLVLSYPKGGNVSAFDKITGKYRPVLDAEGNPVPTGTMSQQDVLDEQGNQKLDQIGATGEQSRETQTMKGQQALDEIAKRTAGQIEVNAAKPEKGMLPTQQKVDQINRAQQIKNTNPQLGKYIEVDRTTGEVILTPSGDPLIDNELKQRIYGPGNDIRLPNESGSIGGTPTSITPGSRTPTANDPLGLR
jgi:hypothetical protein